MATNKILIADDDPIILSGLVNGLKNEGFDVIAANDGNAAVELGRETMPDLAVLDIRMPGMTGLEAARRLRDQAGVESIFLSAYSDREVVEMATKEGALGYLVKPVDINQLVPTIKAALERSGQLHRLQESESNLTSALNRNREISVAIGICMERFQTGEQEAFETLRGYARSERLKLADVAKELVQSAEQKHQLLNRIGRSHQKGR
jgi:AmiR/NasT family two-component response regulator